MLFKNIGLQVIWALGVSMLVLAGLIHLPAKATLAFSCIIIFGHNLLDNTHIEGNFLWSLLHERNRFEWAEGHTIVTSYSLFPWIAVMSLGYFFGSMYDSSFDAKKRQRLWYILGFGCLLLFIILVGINGYGNPEKWINYGFSFKTLMSILDVQKYPPSLRFLLVTLGGTFLFLGNTEKIKGKMISFFSIFGRVPFFYYIIHIYLIHLLALFTAEYIGYGWQSMILPKFVVLVESLKGYGFNLITVYCIWISVVLILFPLCKKFDAYKQIHKEKWWLSYL